MDKNTLLKYKNREVVLLVDQTEQQGRYSHFSLEMKAKISEEQDIMAKDIKVEDVFYTISDPRKTAYKEGHIDPSYVVGVFLQK
jgi:hypothetical protein